MGVMNLILVSLVKSPCFRPPPYPGTAGVPPALLKRGGRDARGPSVGWGRSADLSSIKPKHFAAAFLGIEPQKARLRISLLQHRPVAPDLAKQARVGRQVAACIVDDPAYDRNTVGTAVEGERGLVATFGRQRSHAWGVDIRRIGNDQVVTRAPDRAEQAAFMQG